MNTLSSHPASNATRVTRRTRSLGALTAAVALLAGGCYLLWHYASGGSTQTEAPAAAFTSSGRIALQLRDRVLTPAMLSGFLVTDQPNVIRFPEVWATTVERSARPAAEADRLRRLGYVAGIDEHLHGRFPLAAEAISIVEQFRSPASARAELAYQYARQRALARGPRVTFRSFHLSSIPEWLGWEMSDRSSVGLNISFTAGRFYYVVGVGAPAGARGLLTRPRLITAVQSLYVLAVGCVAPRGSERTVS